MYTEKKIVDNLSTDKISLIMRNQLIFSLDENKNISREMTDFLIYLIQENEMMMKEKEELMKKNDYFFIRTSEQIEYKTYLSRCIQDKVKKKLKELKLIDYDNKSLFNQTRFKVNIEEITQLLNDNEIEFRNREYFHQTQILLSKEKRDKHINFLIECQQKNKDIFDEINHFKYEDFYSLRDFMIQNNFTLIDSIIISVVSKTYLFSKNEIFDFKLVDLNTIRKYVSNISRVEEQSNRDISIDLDINRLIRACKSTKKGQFIRDKYETLSLVDRYLYEEETMKINSDYRFEDDEFCEIIMNKIEQHFVSHLLSLIHSV